MWGAKRNHAQGVTVMHVSIHAPVWGAKFAFGKAVELLKVSIHAPVWGAKYGTSRDATLSCFNPRTRVGCECGTFDNTDVTTVSIHAPVWGAKDEFFYL